MILGTDDVVTLDEGSHRRYYSLTLDIYKKRLYWLKYYTETKLCSIILSDYDGKHQKNLVTKQALKPYSLGVSNNSIFVVKNDETSILVMYDTEKNLSRSFTIKLHPSQLFVFNNNLAHATGE